MKAMWKMNGRAHRSEMAGTASNMRNTFSYLPAVGAGHVLPLQPGDKSYNHPFTGFLIFLLVVALTSLANPLRAQYTLDELAVNVGGGLSIFQNDVSPAIGPGAQANFVYGHYLCGKAYGFHIEGGFAAYLPSYNAADVLIAILPDEPLSFTSAGVTLGAYAKLRPRDYHRPREFAVLFGPKVLLPVIGRYSAGSQTGAIRDVASSTGAIQVGGHLALQFRRPAADKKSWFIEPAVDYYFMPAFNANPAGDVRNLFISLNFGWAFWDKRG